MNPAYRWLSIPIYSCTVPDVETEGVVADRVRAVRESRVGSVRQLSSRLEENGYRLIPSGISKIENGDRGVSVGDLLALALALGITPAALLCDLNGAKVALTETVSVQPADLLLWLWGEQTTPGTDDPTAGTHVHPGAQLLRHLVQAYRRAVDAERQLQDHRRRDPEAVRAEAARMVEKHGGTVEEYVTGLAHDYERHATMNRQLVQGIAADLAAVNVVLPVQIADWLGARDE